MLQWVLLIDDNALQLRMREAVLRHDGFHVCIATNAASALALLRSTGNTIGTVVTDHVLPGLNGAEFVRAIRKLQPRLPIIVITGMPEAKSEYAGLDVEFRQKPCHPSELIALVRRAMPRAA